LVIGRVLGNDGSGTYAAIASGIRWAADQRAIIISMSLGGSSGSQALSDAIDYAAGKGCLIIAAAGNSNSSSPSYPAYYTKVLAVGAVDNNDVKASFSNFGSWVDIVAPGVNIASTYPTNQYVLLSGTSMATPIVAGSAALVWKYFGTSNGPTFVRNKLTQKGNTVTFGGESKPRVNPYRSITLP
jgi:thermitase